MSIDIYSGGSELARLVTTDELPDLLVDLSEDEIEGQVGLYLETGGEDGVIVLSETFTGIADELEEIVARLRRFAREVGETQA
jgi:Glu-tRNA(Gln) amidotransferase subunit E-like FAD-binding protein